MVGICLVDRDQTVCAVNDVFLSFFQIENAQAILGKKLAEVGSPAAQKILSEVHRRVTESQESFSFNLDGRSALAVPLFGKSGEGISLIALFPNESPPWQSLPSPWAVFFQDPLGNLLAVSDSFVQIFHRNELDFTFSHDVTSYVSPVEISRARRDFLRLLKGRPLLGASYILRDTSGYPIPASVTAFALHGKKKEFFGIAGYVFPLQATPKHPTATLNEVLAELRHIETQLRNSPFSRKQPSHTALLGKLTPREVEILRFLAEGYSTRETAETLGLSPNTVETHRRSILRKLRLKSMAHLVRAAVFFDLVSEDPWE